MANPYVNLLMPIQVGNQHSTFLPGAVTTGLWKCSRPFFEQALIISDR